MRALLITIPLLLVPTDGNTHSWYPTRCCFANRDCGPLPEIAVELTGNGWRIKTTGEIVPFSEAEVSPDGKFHICRVPQTGKRRCFFAPEMGS